MKIGFIGLGKMGGQMVTRILQGGHEVAVLDLSKEAVDMAVVKGAEAATDRADLVSKLSPVIIWLMIPSQFVDDEIGALLDILPEKSILIDGGNSDFRLSARRSEQCIQKGVAFIDVGTSGGVLGLEKGFSMMVGGESEAVETISPILSSLAQPNGWKHFGPAGSGHYIKMVHNAIEYGMMEAYAEGYRLLKEGPYNNLDLAAIGNVWQHGSIISSMLNECIYRALSDNPTLQDIDGYVAESGEARWALEVAKEHGIETSVIQEAFNVRLRSQQGDVNYATKLLSAMRYQFGGHSINKDL